MDEILAYQNENDKLLKNILENTWFKNWRTSDRESDFQILNYSAIEFALDPQCDLACDYCYYSNYGKELFQNVMPKRERIIKNVEKTMNFIYKNNMYVNLELFAGELFQLPYIWEVIEIIYKYIKKMKLNKRPMHIMVPSNMSVLKDGNMDRYEKLINYQNKFNKLGVAFKLSASVDGPFMDYINRPQRNNKNNKYNSHFYENLKAAWRRKEIGIHPMVHSNNIEYWIDNMLWFFDDEAKIIPHVYLLEIRNAQWSKKQARSLFYFLRYLPSAVFKRVGFNLDRFNAAYKDLNGFNILYSPFTTVGRGLGCSLQSSFHLQMDSLKFSPCHRTSYEKFITCEFDFKKNGSYELLSKNIEVFIAEQATVAKTMVPCSTCTINELCKGTCLGANYEATGDLFTVPPSVCRMFFMKHAGIFLGLEDVGYLDILLNKIRHNTKKYVQAKLLIKQAHEVIK